MLTVENNENHAVCAKCGGNCCKRTPGIYSPEQFGAPDNKQIERQLYSALMAGRAQIDWWEGDPRKDEDRFNPKRVRYGYYVRPPIKGHLDEFEFGSWGGECALLTERGCVLPFYDRPIACQMLVPRTNNDECVMTHPDGNDWEEKREMAVAWIPYHRQIRRAIRWAKITTISGEVMK